MKSVLSIDGGGMRAIVSAVVIERLEELLASYSGEPDARIADYFDFVAGTSAGGILACAYLCPSGEKARYSAAEITEMFTQLGKKAFRKCLFRRGVFSPRYSDAPLRKVLNGVFGDIRMSELLRDCLVTAYDIKKGKCFFFDRRNAMRTEMRNYLVRDAVLATSCAPTYFPAATLRSLGGEEYTLIDGGVFANNPSVCALVEVRKIFTRQDILFLSVGNIRRTARAADADNYGTLQWAIPLFDTIMTGVMQSADYQMRHLFFANRDDYTRIDVESPEAVHFGMDDTNRETVSALLEAGKEVCRANDGKLRDFAQRAVALKRRNA